MYIQMHRIPVKRPHWRALATCYGLQSQRYQWDKKFISQKIISQLSAARMRWSWICLCVFPSSC